MHLTFFFFTQQIYKFTLEVVFKMAPTVLIAFLNIRIMIVYRKTCNNRRRMTSHSKEDDTRKFAEERRLMLLLGEN